MDSTNMMKLLLGVTTVLMLTLSSGIWADGAVYRWEGKDGVVHYGATPPKGVKAKLIKANARSSSNGTPTATDSSANASASESAEAPKAKLSPEMAAKKTSMCQKEKDRLSALRQNGRIRMEQADGSTKYLSVEEIAGEIAVSEQVIQDICN